MDQMNRLKLKVMQKVKVKLMNGHALNGPMLVELATAYISALNDGAVPNIESAWTNVCSFEQERTLKDCITMFRDQLHSKITTEDIAIKEVIQTVKSNVIGYLKNNFIGEGISTYEKKLKAEMKAIS